MNPKALLPVTLSGVLLAGAAIADEPPDDTIAQEIMEESGYFPIEEGSDEAWALLESEAYVKSERLSRGNVSVYRLNRRALADSPGLGKGRNLFALSEVMEVVTINVRGEPLKHARRMPADEVARRDAEADGVSTESLAKGLRNFSSAQLALGIVLQNEVESSPFGSLFVPVSSYMNIAKAAGETNEEMSCVELLEVVSGKESALYGAEVKPWTSINPMSFMMGQACFVSAVADGLDGTNALDRETAEEIGAALESALGRIQYAGTDIVDGSTSHHIRTEGLNISETVDGRQMVIDAMSIWIDAAYLVRRKTRLEGVIHEDRESREFFMEKLEQDYRNVPDSTLYEPYREVLRMGGMMGPEQQAELREAEGQLEELERQIADMPADQRAMMERMMGDRMNQLRSLASGGAVEFALVTDSIEVNRGFGSETLTLAADDQEEPAQAIPADDDPEALDAARQACLQDKIEAAQAARKKKRGFGRLMSAVGRIAGQTGNEDLHRTVGEVYSANATAADLSAAARDLGLTEEEIADCRDPG